ncbi:MAG: PAS domain-containing sensor histidine kinase [Chloroflexi bacterium]|nr:PAS domain-containing sensor histidine kinase [Chloroflexota bacterium]
MTTRFLSHTALEMLVRTSADAVIAVDQGGQVCLFNPAAEHAFGVHAADVMWSTLGHHPALAPLLALYRQIAPDQDSVRAVLTLPSGAVCPVQVLRIISQDEIAPADPPPPNQLPQMMHAIVHDLKLPLSAAKSFIDLIPAVAPLNEKQAGFAHRAQNSMLSMSNMINELLDMAWMEGDGQLHLAPTDFCHLVHHTIGQLEGYAQYRGVELDVSSPSECVITADERRLQSAIMNLVGNAIKYSPNGGLVQVVVQIEPQQVTFQVIDHGIGIAPEHIGHLFQHFYRAQNPDTRRIEGTGLGLAIVKTIVDKHGGKVFVESELGQGSTFGFTLPRV